MSAKALRLIAVDDAPLSQVVGGDLKGDFIARYNLDEELAHLARDVRQDFVPILQAHAIHRGGQDLDHYAIHLDCIITRHKRSFVPSS